MIKRGMIIGLLSLLCMMVYAAEDEECLHGKIVDQETRQPIEGVEVYTDNLPDIVKTNADGEFKFERCVSVRNFFNKSLKEAPFIIRGNTISFVIKEPQASVKINIYNIAGKLLKTIVNQKLTSNSYSFKLPLKEFSTSTSLGIIKLQINNKSFTSQLVWNKNGILNSGKIEDAKSGSISKGIKTSQEQEPIDYLYLSKEGYLTFAQGIPLYSYKGRIDTALLSEDTIPPKIDEFLWPDTAWYDWRDSVAEEGGWKKFWFMDSVFANVKFSDNRDSYLRPSTNTNEHTQPCFDVVRFMIEDMSSNYTEKTLFLILYDSTLIDTVAPTMTIDPETLIVSKGDIVVLDSGITITDDVDTHIVNWKEYLNITDDIKSTKERFDRTIIADIPGTYTVTYRIIDTHRNMVEKKRILIVNDTEGNKESQ